MGALVTHWKRYKCAKGGNGLLYELLNSSGSSFSDTWEQIKSVPREGIVSELVSGWVLICETTPHQQRVTH